MFLLLLLAPFIILIVKLRLGKEVLPQWTRPQPWSSSDQSQKLNDSKFTSQEEFINYSLKTRLLTLSLPARTRPSSPFPSFLHLEDLPWELDTGRRASSSTHKKKILIHKMLILTILICNPASRDQDEGEKTRGTDTFIGLRPFLCLLTKFFL